MSPATRSTRRRRAALLLSALVLVQTAAVGVMGAGPAAAAGTGSVSGVLKTDLGTAIPDAHVTLTNRQSGATRTAISGSTGTYSLADVAFGDYDVSMVAPCTGGATALVRVDGAETLNLDFLDGTRPFDQSGHSCRPSSFALIGDDGVLPLTGDDASTFVPLPFDFPFYGREKAGVRVSTNGYLTFGEDDGRSNVNRAVLDPLTPRDSIFAFWDDLVLDASASVATGSAGTAPNRVFMVEWRNVKHFGDPAGHRITFQVQLFENGRIHIGWRDLDPSALEQGGSATIGIRSAFDGDGLQQSFDTASLVDGLKVEYVVNRPPVAKAGPDRTVASGATFPLDASGSTDADGTSGLAFAWTQLAGPATTIQDPRKAKTQVTGVGGPKTLTYQVRVTDPFGRSSFDTVTVTVTAPAPK